MMRRFRRLSRNRLLFFALLALLCVWLYKGPWEDVPESQRKNTMVDAAVLEKLEAGFKKLESSDSKSLLKKYLTKEVFDALKTKKTSFGSTLLDCIQSGEDNRQIGLGYVNSDLSAIFLPNSRMGSNC
ncbi:hypothetical protein J437_LFUL005623 [Ladona fulva]|uniref:Phosphagen kinase N-terminal domain-containing protein n=1 Tax=Ladona fulva TaxID=123851 RepID=A0A8K0NXN1_LADFU|nr:hypothetical protein J437_LFUL005623 [Ladona fulva]